MNWLIFTNKSYTPGKSSRRNSLCYSFYENKVKEYQVTNKRILKNLKKYKKQQEKFNFATCDKIHLEIIENLRKLELPELTEENLLFFTKDGTVEQLNSNIISYNQMRNKEIFYKVDDNGRLHNNITNMSSKLRKLLKYDNKPLVWADIHNSQYVFLLSIIHTLSSFHNQTNTHIQQHPPYDGSFEEELEKFKNQVENGKFYDICADKMGLSRDIVKKNLIQVLFDKPRKNCKYTKYYKKYFPHIYGIICQFKAEDYADLANFLQQTEAQIIFEACKLIKQTHPDVPIFTIHDSIGTSEGNLGVVVAAMMAVFKKYGLNPSLGLEFDETKEIISLMKPLYYMPGEPVLMNNKQYDVIWSDSNGYMLSGGDGYYEYGELFPVPDYEYAAYEPNDI